MLSCLLRKKEFLLPLNDVGMIAGDTSRSRAYLQALARNDLLPNYVILLEHASEKLFPGQLEKSRQKPEREINIEVGECWSETNFDTTQPIKELLDDLGTPYDVFTNKDINDSEIIECIRTRAEMTFIYSGFGGVLLRRDVLSLGKHFLHVHGGFLPDYKGSTTNYYSLLIENTLGASSIFLSEQIDSGSILLRKRMHSPANREAIDHIYDSGVRAKVLVETLQNYLKCGKWEFELPENSEGETYYIIHPVLKHIAILGEDSSTSCI